MEDKFGYLMKEEAELHMIEEMRRIRKEHDLNSLMGFKAAYNVAFATQRNVIMTWGGRHPEDEEAYKIR